ncbi:VC2662 family protein [Parendozoicomonas haliclonae]|uniref:PhaC PHA synthase n=1 Tax=Parendozoicomonas haliclonae TaxID=1960125 RepID=A0A1X7AFX8_9GAMM|nr:phaC PHA synthase [Parendozoicomonas haliclonae]SMA31599.1 hypothetical protein EHSB41UT_00034 [Parendozoicomonas haliclonae]
MKKLFKALAVASVMVSSSVFANSPAMFSTLDGTNLPEQSAVGGVRFSVLHGQVNEVKGIDISALGLSESDRTTGLNLGIFFGASKVNQEMKGVSFSALNWNEGQATGLNLGFVNLTNNVKGLNLSAVNFSEGHTMADVGFFSLSAKSNFQLGFVNVTDHIDGVQIGLVNCAENGFFKCFPLVNFAK